MNKFIEKIKNKRVAIIGPADYVNKELDETHGDYINSFDTVIRLNSMIKFPRDELEKYYGKKFDILFSSFWPFNDAKEFIKGELNKSRNLYLDSYKDISNNLLIYDYHDRQFHKEYILNKFKNFFNRKKNFTFVSTIYKIHYLMKLFNLKKTPTTGLACILTCLLNKPKELYISGITFYQDKIYNGYYDKYFLITNQEYNTLVNNKNYRFNGKQFRKGFIFGHNVNDEYHLFKKILNKLKFIKIDKYLDKILKKKNHKY